MPFHTKNDIKEICLQNASVFGKTAAKMLNNILGTQYSAKDSEYIEAGISIENKFVISIVYTGTVYGEYIFVMDENTAAQSIGSSFQNQSPKAAANLRKDISDTFSEVLNITVGESILTLNEHFDHLTFTAPRVLTGSVNYPKFKSGNSSLVGPHGPIECYLFIDCMRLDIATSYRKALNSLEITHSELKKAIEQLQKQQAILVQNEKMAALGTMAAGVAHEINTPLATVKLVSANLKAMIGETIFDPELFSMDIDIIEKTAARIGTITNALKTFAYGAKQTVFEELTIETLIDDVLTFYGHHLKKNEVQMIIQRPVVDSKIEYRISELSQVLLNLMVNANDAIVHLPEKWISIDTTDLGEQLAIGITDSGHGIPPEIRDKMFDPFFTTKGVGKGTGLGLSISQGIIESHGGTLTIDTACPNTRVVITLPKFQKRA